MKRGFTLIELLVVIAIIGILSSVVLASLNSARTKSKDATVLADMDTLSPQAVLYQDQNAGSYGDTGGVNDCTIGLFSDTTFQSVFAAVAQLNNNGAKACYATGNAYAVGLARPIGNGYTPPSANWCVDSPGKKCGINDLSPLSSGTCGCP